VVGFVCNLSETVRVNLVVCFFDFEGFINPVIFEVISICAYRNQVRVEI